MLDNKVYSCSSGRNGTKLKKIKNLMIRLPDIISYRIQTEDFVIHMLTRSININ